MSRHGYSDDSDDQWATICWRGAVASALRGKRGQTFLRETLAALDALPKPELITNNLSASGAFCTLGAVGRARQADLSTVDVEDYESVAALFGVPRALACEVMWENDEAGSWAETPRARWERMRRWIVKHLNDDQPVFPAESGASSPSEASASAPATDDLNTSSTTTPTDARFSETAKAAEMKSEGGAS